MMKFLTPLLKAVSSLQLTLLCLGAALVLVFAGTLAQRQLDTFYVQREYFQSWFVMWSATPDFSLPVFPGGHLIGGVLLLNLITAHIRRFSWTWKKLGIQLTHFGLIVMLGGGLATDLLSVSSFMVIPVGGTASYSYNPDHTELALADVTDPTAEQVTVIPDTVLNEGGPITHPSLPFKIVVRNFFENSQLSDLKPDSTASAAATNGIGARASVRPQPRATHKDQFNTVSAVVEIVPTDGSPSLGTWLVSDAMAGSQSFDLAGRKWNLELRYTRYYKAYSLTLDKIAHDVYPGTQIPKNYSSTVTLDDPQSREHRQVLIWMNHPLRYQGDTYYQHKQDSGSSTFQVVRNPSFLAPYVACVIVGLGLIVQFSYHLIRFARRTRVQPAAAL